MICSFNNLIFLPIVLSIFIFCGCGTEVSPAVDDIPVPSEITSAETEVTSSESKTGKNITETDIKDAAAYDLLLVPDKTEFTVGDDKNVIRFKVTVPPEFSPAHVDLVNADTGEKIAEMYDDADYEHSGDDLGGDNVYNCIYEFDDDIGTDPDVSEERYDHYYAEFTENNVTHRSDTVEIWLLEQFTDKELDDMETVDNAISELMDSDEFKSLSEDEKCLRVKKLLNDLGELVRQDSIYISGDTVTFEYACGISGGVKVTPFDPRMN